MTAKPETTLSPAQVKRAQRIAVTVQRLHGELFDLGLVQTAAKMAAVNQKLGWEMADKMEDVNPYDL